MQVNTNLTKIRLYSTKILKNLVDFMSCSWIVSNFSNPNYNHTFIEKQIISLVIFIKLNVIKVSFPYFLPSYYLLTNFLQTRKGDFFFYYFLLKITNLHLFLSFSCLIKRFIHKYLDLILFFHIIVILLQRLVYLWFVKT